MHDQPRTRTERTRESSAIRFRSSPTQNANHTIALSHDHTIALKIEVEARRVWNGEQQVRLTRLEFEVLVYLARRAGKVVTFQELWRAVWDNELKPGKTEQQAVRQAIKRVRGKLGESRTAPRWIYCVHGVGFRFRQDAVEWIE
ncbi:MAG: winged helix-turn-helix transcriptional regulator [Chloroflexi bacterium]|nr:winged helix-turn-helix transcriptional regulator [Chloroflexota bacterium]